TIGTFSGLLDDLLLVQEQGGKPLSSEKLQGICSKIVKQVDRGDELLGRLNRFAHTVDVPQKNVDVKSVLIEICDICNRFAKLAEVSLERRFPENTPMVTTDVFAFQHVVFLCIKEALKSAAHKRTVTVAIEPLEDGCKVVVESDDPLRNWEDNSVVQQLVSDLRTKLEKENINEKERYSFIIR
ncbi:MAG: hypothetical protein V1754_12805, partial [Pseudomonadota bacterium]